MRTLSFLLTAAAVGTLPVVQARAQAPSGGADRGGAPARPGTVEASAEGTSTAAADQATVDIAVMTDAPTAEEASADNTRKTDAVLRALRTRFGAETPIKTTAFSMYPRYEAPQPGRPSAIAGYAVRNSLEMTVRDLTTVGQVVQTALASGVNEVPSVHYGVRDEAPARARALAEAVGAARDEASTMAKALGLRVSRVVSVEEDPRRTPAPVTMRAQPAPAEAAPVPLQPGVLEYRAHVRLTAEVVPVASGR